MSQAVSLANIKKCSVCGTPYRLKFGVFIPDCKCGDNHFAKMREVSDRIRKRRDLRLRYLDAQFPPIYYGWRLKDLTCEHVNEAKVYVDCFHRRSGRGFHYVGSKGNGKTTLAVCIGKELIAKGFKVKFMTFAKYVRILQSTYGNKNPLSFDEQIEKFLEYDFLILDDFGREGYKDKTLSDVFEFLNTLYSFKQNVIITSNPEMIEKIKLIPDFSAILDRFKKITAYRYFNAPSMRCA